MKKIIEIYKGLSFLFTQTKMTIISIEQCYINPFHLDKIKFKEEFYNKVTYSETIRALLSNYSLIQFCSFLEEYKRFNQSISEDETIKERISNVRNKNKYGLKRIACWKDLEKIRNQLLAHNFQVKNKSFFDNEKNSIIEYNVPDTLGEKIIFIEIIEKICLNILSEFPEILNISNIETYKMSENLKISKNYIDLEKEMADIKKLM